MQLQLRILNQKINLLASKPALVTSIFMLYFATAGSQGLQGSGTESDPYYGAISTNTIWNAGRTIFAENLTIASGCTLEIAPGDFYGTFLNMLGFTLSIENGGTFILDPLSSATISEVINNGNLILESFPGEPGVASLIFDSYSGSGACQIKSYISGGITPGGSYIWHYIAVPVSGILAQSFGSLDLVQYVESLSTNIDNVQSWVAWDGYQYSSGIFLPQYSFSTLQIGKGYNYYSASGSIFTFNGIPNVAQNTQYLSYSGTSGFQGFNLVGNPFSSCIDWEYLCPTFTRSINNAIYYTNRGTYPAYVGGIGTDGGTQYIPPMQGFFVKANALNGRIIFTPGARTHSFDQMRYKKGDVNAGERSDTISFIRLQMKNDNDSTDAVVRFNKKATSLFDTTLDAYKFSKTTGDLNIWTTSGNIDLSINGLPFPSSSIDIPVGLNVKTPGIFRLWLKEINKLENYAVILKDLTTNTIIDMKSGDAMISYIPTGIIENRFVLKIANITTIIPEILPEKEMFTIYFSDGNLNILSLSDEFCNSHGSITLLDFTGKRVYQENNIKWFGSGDLKQFPMNLGAHGLYIVEIRAGDKRVVKKVINK